MAKRKQARLQAFEHLFRSNYRHLFSLGFRMSADREMAKDTIQGLFLELWEKGGLPSDVRYPTAYLQKAFSRKMIGAMKKQNKQQVELSNKLTELTTPSYEELLINFQQETQRRDDLRQAVANLPTQMKEILHLRFLAGMSYEDIAQRTGKSKQTIYNQIYEAIKKLKHSLLAIVLVILGFLANY